MARIIDGVHTIISARDADKARAFLKTVLGFSSVDAGGGWLIFKAPPSEIAVHPASAAGRTHHELFLMCRDINRCVRTLKDKGVKFLTPVTDQKWGLMTRFELPGAGAIGLYEPRHASPLQKVATVRASRRGASPSPARRRRRAVRP